MLLIVYFIYSCYLIYVELHIIYFFLLFYLFTVNMIVEACAHQRPKHA